MKKVITAVALVTGLLLGGCATVGPGPSPAPSPIVIGGTTTVNQIVTAVVMACKFKPTEQTVAAILATFVPGFSPANGIVNWVTDAVCNAVSAKSVAKANRTLVAPSVNGVRIKGKYVR